MWWVTGVPCTQCFWGCFSQLCGCWTPDRAEKAQPWLGEGPCLLYSLGGTAQNFLPGLHPIGSPQLLPSAPHSRRIPQGHSHVLAVLGLTGAPWYPTQEYLLRNRYIWDGGC